VAARVGREAVRLRRTSHELAVSTTFSTASIEGWRHRRPFGGLGPAEGAQTYDRANVFKSEIDGKLTSIARRPRWHSRRRRANEALAAARIAEANGASGSATIVRSKAEEYAGELYAAAVRELDANPKEAKRKLLEVKTLVPASSSLFGKATKQLAQINGS
jgi:hypothetical protein